MSRPLALATAILLLSAPPALAALRLPQVPVSGASLQNLLNAQLQAINVASQQQDLQRWNATSGGNPTPSFQLSALGNVSAFALGIYNASAVAPALYPLFPVALSPGWFVGFSFRTSPTRVVANIFDASSALVASNTYAGVDPTNLGFYLQGSNGTFDSQDARNPDHAAHMLTYNGSGSHSGGLWLCWEDRTAALGGDFNFSDAVYVIDSFFVVPVSHTTWGTLKARFR